jgi:undecaprenyl-diphosphatase
VLFSRFVLYFKRFFQTWDFYFKLFVAFIPAVVLGLLFSDLIDELLESPVTVAVSLLLGGIVLLKLTSGLIIQRTLNNLSDGIQNRIIPMPRNGSQVSRVALWVECLKTNSYISLLIFIFSCCPDYVWRNGKKMLRLLQDGFVLTHDQINLLIIGNVIAFIVAS